jgi:anti-sigma B factor antagonist
MPLLVSTLQVDFVSSDDSPVLLRVTGQLDLGTVEAFHSTIERALAYGNAVVLDVRGLEFMDSTGLSALLKAKRTAASRTLEFRIEGERGAVARVLKRTGTLAFLAAPRGAKAPDGRVQTAG